MPNVLNGDCGEIKLKGLHSSYNLYQASLQFGGEVRYVPTRVLCYAYAHRVLCAFTRRMLCAYTRPMLCVYTRPMLYPYARPGTDGAYRATRARAERWNCQR
eukprot:1204051-Rhodomonas_salina.2